MGSLSLPTLPCLKDFMFVTIVLAKSLAVIESGAVRTQRREKAEESGEQKAEEAKI